MSATPTTPTAWTWCRDALPSHEQFGAYPRVLVLTQYAKHPDWGYGMQFAELRYINGDKARPLWVSTSKADNLQPIETTAMGVVAWAPPPATPSQEGGAA